MSQTIYLSVGHIYLSLFYWPSALHAQSSANIKGARKDALERASKNNYAGPIDALMLAKHIAKEGKDVVIANINKHIFVDTPNYESPHFREVSVYLRPYTISYAIRKSSLSDLSQKTCAIILHLKETDEVIKSCNEYYQSIVDSYNKDCKTVRIIIDDCIWAIERNSDVVTCAAYFYDKQTLLQMIQNNALWS